MPPSSFVAPLVAVLVAFASAPNPSFAQDHGTANPPTRPLSELALVFDPVPGAPAADAARGALGGAPEALLAQENGAGLWALRTAAGRISLGTQSFDEALLPSTVDEARFTAAELAALAGERLCLVLATDLDAGGMPRLHQQLKDLVAAAQALGLASPLAMLDVSATRWHPPAWVARMAASEAGPAPSVTFMIHGVRDTDAAGAQRYWIHTHGVARLAGFELGCVDVTEPERSVLFEVIDSAASFAVDMLDWPEREPTQVLYGLELARLPWREGVAALAPRTVGTEEDHRHGHERTSVLAVRDGDTWRSPGEAALALEALIGARSRRETERGALAARETYADLRAWKRKAPADAAVLVKAPLEVEGGGREHVWFEVRRLGRTSVDGVLLSQPHGRAALAPGDRASLDVDELSGWSVKVASRSYGPDELEALQVASSGG